MTRFPRVILGTCCIPWNEDGSFAEQIFRDEVRSCLGHGLTNLYVFGTAGEGYGVTDRQFDEIVRVFADEMAHNGLPPMVGVISLSLGTMIERIERANDMGVRQFQVALPSWGALSDNELAAFFREICARFPASQFLHYNLPRAKRYVTADDYVSLVREHPNLVATKHGTQDKEIVGALMTKVPELRHFITEFCFPHACSLGEAGYLISMGVTNPGEARKFFEAGISGDEATLKRMCDEFQGMLTALFAAVGDPPHIDGAYDKLFCKLLDKRFPLRLLPPYDAVSEAAFRQYGAVLREKYPQWIA